MDEQWKHKKKHLERHNVSRLSESQREMFAKRRLMRDYMEIMKNPLPTVQARPLEGDIFEWHCNVACLLDGPYKDMVFHLIFKFSMFYPMKPPKVTMCNYLKHEHIFMENICLDMLETNFHTSVTEVSAGWSSGYTVQSILVQLQSFLMDQADLNFGDYYVDKTKRSISQFVCSTCGHSASSHNPPLPYLSELKKDDIDNQQLTSNQIVVTIGTKSYCIPEEIWMNIFMFTDINTLTLGVNNSCTKLRGMLSSYKSYKLRSSITCYHSKMTFEQAVLGYGINVEYKKSGSKIPQTITAKLDLISYFAVYKEGITTSMWKEPFEFWLPIYINKRHGNRVIEDPALFQATVERIYGKNFTPVLALDLLTKLMNSMIVTLMNNSIHASLNAVEGYIAFHRLLIALIERYPKLKDNIESKIEKFLADPQERTKANTPSMGDFLPYLTVSEKYGWPDLAIPVLQEVMCRNVLWSITKSPYMNNVTSQAHWSKKAQKDREKDAIQATIVSLRLIMFHVYFLKQFSPMARKLTLKQISEQYDEQYGTATTEMKNAFQTRLFQIMKVNDFKTFFHHCCIEVNSSNFIDEMMTDAWMRSKVNKYHS